MYVNVPVFQISLHCDDSYLIKNPNKNGTFPQNFSLGRCSSLDMRDVSLGGRPVGLAKIHPMQQLQQHLTSLSLTFTFSICDTILVKSCSSYHAINDIIWLFWNTIKLVLTHIFLHTLPVIHANYGLTLFRENETGIPRLNWTILLWHFNEKNSTNLQLLFQAMK